MLLSSILQILNQYQQPQTAVKLTAAAGKAVEKTSNSPSPAIFSVEQENPVEKIESEIAAAAGLLRPLSVDPNVTQVALPGLNLEELMQIVAKLKEPYKSHMLDVFE